MKVNQRSGGDVPQGCHWVIGCFIWGLHETSWISNTSMALDISFETCLRHRGDVLMGCRYYFALRRRENISIWHCRDVPLTHLGGVPTRRRWLFHLRHTCSVAGTYRETLLWCRHNVFCWVGTNSFVLAPFYSFFGLVQVYSLASNLIWMFSFGW